MSNLATSGRSHALHFAGAVGWEVVMMHESLSDFGHEAVDILGFSRATKRDNRENLRLTAGEQSRAMRARQETHFARDWANCREVASVGSMAVVQDFLT